eukprot:SAG31_NODE_4421_length_3249_cov_2.958730_3_plen_153_part_00
MHRAAARVVRCTGAAACRQDPRALCTARARACTPRHLAPARHGGADGAGVHRLLGVHVHDGRAGDPRLLHQPPEQAERGGRGERGHDALPWRPEHGDISHQVRANYSQLPISRWICFVLFFTLPLCTNPCPVCAYASPSRAPATRAILFSPP